MINELIDKDTKINELQNKIEDTLEFCDKCLRLNLEDYDTRILLEKIMEMLGEENV